MNWLGYRTGRVLSPTTHRGDLRLLKRFSSWAHRTGHVANNPFAHVEPLGRDRAGKLQLRMDELDRWLQVAWQDVRRGDALALIAMLCLWRGLRVSEVLNRVVRDLDEEGAVLAIEQAKTRTGNRRIDRSICRRAGVPLICTHSLRRMNATLKVRAGATEDYVARSIGHTSFGVTLRHYVDPTVKETVDARRVDAILSKVGRAPVEKAEPPPSSIRALLHLLSDADRVARRHALILEPVQRQ